MAVTLILKPWTDRAGRERRYVGNLAEVIGLKIQRHSTGSISAAQINGENISNSAARRILDAKVWLDSDDEVHVDYWSEPYVLTEQQVRDAVSQAYTATARESVSPGECSAASDQDEPVTVAAVASFATLRIGAVVPAGTNPTTPAGVITVVEHRPCDDHQAAGWDGLCDYCEIRWHTTFVSGVSGWTALSNRYLRPTT